MHWLWILALVLIALFILVLCWFCFTKYTCCPCRRKRSVEPILPTHVGSSALSSSAQEPVLSTDVAVSSSRSGSSASLPTVQEPTLPTDVAVSPTRTGSLSSSSSAQTPVCPSWSGLSTSLPTVQEPTLPTDVAVSPTHTGSLLSSSSAQTPVRPTYTGFLSFLLRSQTPVSSTCTGSSYSSSAQTPVSLTRTGSLSSSSSAQTSVSSTYTGSLSSSSSAQTPVRPAWMVTPTWTDPVLPSLEHHPLSSHYFPEMPYDSPHLHLRYINISIRRAVKFERGTPTLDLHNMTVKEATRMTNVFLNDNIGQYSAVRIITGRGNNSRGGIARIKPAVVRLLYDNNIKFFVTDNGGCLKVILGKKFRY